MKKEKEKEKEKLKSLRGQIMTEYVILSLALVVGFSTLGILKESMAPTYDNIINSVFYVIAMPF